MKLPFLATAFLFVGLLSAQTLRPLEFEVATVKVSTPPPPGGSIRINLGTFLNGKVTLTNVTLSDCLKFAYNITSDSQIYGPDWIKSGAARFDIVALTPPDTTQDQIRLMTQKLLAERLKVALHREQRELPFLALVVAKNGHKLGPPDNNTTVQGTTGAGRIVHPRLPMKVLASLLSRFERQFIIDMTGLEGPFNLSLQWIPDFLRNRPPDAAPPLINGQPVDTNGPSIYTALPEQLGLRLESRKGPVDVLVVDQAQQVPAEN